MVSSAIFQEGKGAKKRLGISRMASEGQELLWMKKLRDFQLWQLAKYNVQLQLLILLAHV